MSHYGKPQPLSSFDRKDLNAIAGELLELPKELGVERAKLTAQRADKRTLERNIKKAQITVKAEVKDTNEYAELKNAAERNLYIEEVMLLDPGLEGMLDRLDQLKVAIDVSTANIATLEDKRKANYAVLTAYHAAVTHEHKLDEAFAKAQLKGVAA
jgi:hypothetical protein